MNKCDIYQIEDVIGSMFHYYYEDDIGGLTGLFTGDAVIRLPDHLCFVRGKAQISSLWRQMILDRKPGKGSIRTIHYPCEIFLEPCEDGTYAGEWNTYSFRSEREGEVQYFLTHMEADFSEESGEWKFNRLVWNEILEMVPWTESDRTGGIARWHLTDRALSQEEICIRRLCAGEDTLSTQDYLEIRNLQSHFTHQGKDRDGAWFAKDAVMHFPTLYEEDAQGRAMICKRLKDMAQKEAENDKNYLCLPVVTAPVIRGKGDHASACWLMLDFEVKAGAFSVDEPPYPIMLHAGRFVQEFVRENGEWKFKTFSQQPLWSICCSMYDPAYGMRHRMGEKHWENTWMPGPVRTGIPCPEDAPDVEMIMPQWTGRLRTDSSMDFVDRYMVNDKEEIWMLVAGSRLVKTVGYDQICERFGPKPKTGRRENPVFHTLSTPLVEFDADGEHARAAWTDFSIADFTGAPGFPEKPVCYYTTVSKYYHEFVRDTDGTWKLYGFGWEPCMPLGGWPFDAAACRGFYKGWDQMTAPFPGIGESYPYDANCF